MFQFVEPRVRRIVAEHLGVGLEELAAEVSLTDDLAADSLDLLDLALALEADLRIEFPEAALERIRTYGELVDTVFNLARRRPVGDVAAEAVPIEAYVWARVLPRGDDAGQLQRGGWLTPYTAETIAEDALRSGRGTRLEVTVPSGLNDAAVAQLQEDFAWLGEHGVQVSVRRQHAGPLGAMSRPHAAA